MGASLTIGESENFQLPYPARIYGATMAVMAADEAGKVLEEDYEETRAAVKEFYL